LVLLLQKNGATTATGMPGFIDHLDACEQLDDDGAQADPELGRHGSHNDVRQIRFR
jgi:hypothetical protein